MIILYILKILGILVFSLLAAILFIPIRYSFAGTKVDDSASVRASISLFFGLVRFVFRKKFLEKEKLQLQVFGLKFKINTDRKASAEKKKKDVKEDIEIEEKHKGMNFSAIFDKKLRKTFFDAFIKIFNHIKPKHFYLEGKYGFEDPYYTGITLAAINILAPILKQYRINARAVFDDEILEGRMLISGKVVIYKLVFIALKLCLNKNVRRALKHKEEKAYAS
jgi:hypothetical protein